MQIINKVLWSVAIIMIFLNSIYFSIKLKFPQIRIKTILKTIFTHENNTKNSNISSKDSLLISLASKIGAGSLAGISFAIYYGGIGTIFWMWVAAFFVSINCFLENMLAIIYKEKDGSFYKGGPAYYIRKGLNKKNLAIIYSILAIGAYIFGFLAIQNNTITTLVTEIYDVNSCDKCINGYHGRAAIHEVLLINDEIKDALSNERQERDDLREIVYGRNNVVTLLQDGLQKIIEGQTTFDEVYKLIEVENDIEEMLEIRESLKKKGLDS